jgi:hypothetical protein
MNPVSKIVSQVPRLTIAKNKFSFFVFFVLILLGQPVLAEADLNIISSVYFNSDNSFVIETANLANLKPDSVDKNNPGFLTLNFSNVQIAKNLSSKITTQDFQLELIPMKSNQGWLLKKYDRLQIVIKSRSLDKDLDVQARVLLSGFASQYKLNTSDLIVTKPELVPETPAQIHPVTPVAPINNQLRISFTQNDFKASQEFLERINQTNLLNDDKLSSEILAKVDIVALEQIAQHLSQQGQKQESELAIRKILSLDPTNNKALIALADITNDTEEKNQIYLKALDQRALTALAESWTLQKQSDSPAKAILMRQISILKDPHNPELRLECARLYESMGFSYYTLSAKRYLESAVLAKNQYLSGNLQAEPTLRTATESLIRLLSHQGDEQMAIKYCQSYLDLGFRRFTDGKPIVAVIKELQAHQNPFRS